MTPRPVAIAADQSVSSSAGSPKKPSPPCCSSVRSWRWMVPTVALLTLPYCVVSVAGVLGDPLQQRLQVLEVEQQQALLVGDLKTMLSTPSCVSLSSQQARQQQRPDLGDRRADRMALLAEQVPEDRREGAAGIAVDAELLARARAPADCCAPAWPMPDRSPFTSAMKTGTPSAEKPSAMVCRVTVLPVPVAPAIRPWRLAYFSRRYWSAVARSHEDRSRRSCRLLCARPDFSQSGRSIVG